MRKKKLKSFEKRGKERGNSDKKGSKIPDSRSSQNPDLLRPQNPQVNQILQAGQ